MISAGQFGLSFVQTGVETIIEGFLNMKVAVQVKLGRQKLCDQGLPKQKKVDTFIYRNGHRVVYSLLGKGEVSNKYCVL